MKPVESLVAEGAVSDHTLSNRTLSDQTEPRTVEASTRQPILVLAALPGETKVLRTRLRGRRREILHGVRTYKGSLPSAPEIEIWVAHCGIGPTSALAFCTAFPWDVVEFRGIWIVGLAGGLDPELPVGALVRIETARRVGGQPIALRAKDFLLSLPFPCTLGGVALSTERVLTTAEEKNRLWRESGCERHAVVDMETYALCDRMSADPRLPRPECVRVISDAAGEDLPLVLREVEGGGSMMLWKVSRSLVLKPWTIFSLLELGRRLRRSSRNIARWVDWRARSLAPAVREARGTSR